MQIRPVETSEKKRLVKSILVTEFKIEDNNALQTLNSDSDRINLLTSYLRLQPTNTSQIPILREDEVIKDSLLSSNAENRTYTLQQQLTRTLDKRTHWDWILADQEGNKKAELKIRRTGKGVKWQDFQARHRIEQGLPPLQRKQLCNNERVPHGRG